jgi:DNA gyrase subunit A
MERNLTPIIEQSFTQYAGAVLQSRALVDVRDCLKPSARQIFYSMWRNKYIHSKPYEKTNAPMGDAMKDFYIHGNASCVGIMMRAAQDFSMRVPLCEVQGNCGTLISSGNWASERYTSTRLAEIADYLFANIDKETIDEWRDNYADNLQYPAVLPSKGYYNLVNGSSGIAVGMSASLPAFNLREMNEMLIRLLENPDLPAKEAVILPDFPTGAILLNRDEVIESLLNGRGKACKLRSVVSFDVKERCLIVSEIPYGTYTNTICGQLSEILESDENPGIERFNDLTGKTALIKIYLTKTANPDKVLKYLYKNTSLQSYYSINMTMLDKGKYPKVFSLKEAMMEFLAHQKDVYTRGFQFDLKKIIDRLSIIDGLIRAYNQIEEVIQTIKKSADSKSASVALQKLLSINERQAKAILDLKLARLSHLDIDKLLKEQSELEVEKARIEAILADESLLKKEIEKGLREVMDKFGDDRRTQILNLSADENDEPVEVKKYQVSLTNQNEIYVSEISSLYSQSRNTVGSKMKLADGEYITYSTSCMTGDVLLFFTRKGQMYARPLSSFENEKKTYLDFAGDDKVLTLTSYNKTTSARYAMFITKQGFVKKTELKEYNTNRSGGIKAIEFATGDELVNVLLINEENLALSTKKGQLLIIETDSINAIGRATKGVRGIKLSLGDEVSSARAITSEKEIVVVSKEGLAKRLSVDELPIQGRYTKGVKAMPEGIVDFVALQNERELVVISTSARLRIKVEDLPLQSRTAQGVKTLKLSGKNEVIGLVKI